MGFFKNIGKAIKKNVSFKNLVKVATPIMGAIPIVGGTVQNISQKLQDAHEAKKEAQNAQNEYDRQVAEANAEALRLQALQTAGQTVGAVAGAGTQIFSKAVTEGAYAGLGAGTQQGLGTVGAEIADSTISAWFKKHWKHILIGLSVIGAIYLIRKHNEDKYPRKRARR
ncbi:hypothetical protein HNP37_003984 [Flavobacterium nitrogenifigens]|uniref:Uncharacterized protein n=2 Tax=Flavobacterium TaxID=237 RepID=A0A7W7J0C9_9FLAO|nr:MULTISPECIES: hypothetical protein [Flavobacterium]MBB4803904.1 hypothetical protein [Flavobacterium nitrogenifigens]MBB6388944.1 hypothetical protein [Flavobacterium notoginsengisoli]